MIKLSKFLFTIACSAALSAAVSAPAWAKATVIRNNADWVTRQEADQSAAEAAQAAEEAAEEERQEAEAAAEAQAAAEESARQEEAEQELRQSVVSYALSFVGGRYVYGGTDPHSGVDCSGFTRYVLKNAAGILVGRSSRDQAAEGTTVSADSMQPGDLLFYASGSRVNHVAMYIGDGKIVHASTERTGIKVSAWNYRSPVRIASFLG